MTKKAVSLLVFILVSLSCIWSASVSYVYGNQVSSIDFEVPPRVGTMFKDSKNNVLIVANNSEKVVVFDRLSTNSKVEIGDNLKDEGRMHTFFARASFINASIVSIGYSFSTALYPIRPVLLCGFTFNPLVSLGSSNSTSTNSSTSNGSSSSSSTTRIFVTAGLETSVLFSNLWDTTFTLVEDGGINGWCTAGVFVYPNVEFACSYGFSYRHYIGSFQWEIGLSWLRSLTFKYYTSFVGFGVFL